MQKIAVYPGTFDPVTWGHVDIISRGCELFDRVIVAVAINVSKTALFSAEERVRLLEDATQNLPTVSVCQMNGLLVNFARSIGACTILRGLRAVADFEYEFQMAAMNRKLDPKVETAFLMAGESTSYISSKLVKEIARMGGDAGLFVPPAVMPALMERIQKKDG